MEPQRRRIWAVAVSVFILAIVLAIFFAPLSHLKWISEKEVYAMAIPATFFPIVYTALFPWWKSPLGRALFIKSFGLFLLIDLAVAFDIFGEFLPPIRTAFVVYTVVLFGMSYQLIVISKIGWTSRREHALGRYEALSNPDSKSPEINPSTAEFH